MSVLAILLLAAASEAGVWYAPFLPQEIGGWKAEGAARTYGRSSIFDYMDGAGELYLAYDFQEIAVRDYAKPGAPRITAEIYRMASSKDAYGAWTADQGASKAVKEVASIGQDRDYAAGLLRFWKGKTFVRILADRETPESRAAVLTLGKLISGKITSIGRRPDVIGLLPGENLVRESVRFFHKYTVLNYHFYLSDTNILNLGPKTDAVLAQYKLNGAKPRLLIVRYPTDKDASAAFTSFNRAYFKDKPASKSNSRIEPVEHNHYTGIKLEGRVLRIVFEADKPDTVQRFLKG